MTQGLANCTGARFPCATCCHTQDVVNQGAAVTIAVGVTVILLTPHLPVLGVSIALERERQQNDSLANG